MKKSPLALAREQARKERVQENRLRIALYGKAVTDCLVIAALKRAYEPR